MPVIIGFFIMLTFLGTIYPIRDLPKGDMQVFPHMAGAENLPLRYTVKPLTEEFRFKNIVKQEFDYSCGSAALATLLNYYLGERFSEQQIIQGLMNYGDADKIEQRRAFSLLDMKRFCEVLGYKAEGYKAELNDLKSLHKPAIVPIELSGYKHFVVYRGIYNNHIFFADPFRGNSSFSLEEFLPLWSQNIIFVVSSDAVKTNALRLKNEDLRIIDYDFTRDALVQIPIPQTVTEQQRVSEALGGNIFKTLNAH
jgi:uncharacterized protein